MTTNWNEMTTDQRRQVRFERWRSPEKIEFASDEIRTTYATRIQRVLDAIELKQTPDRVPTISPAGFLPCFLYGVSCRDAMYNIDLAAETWGRFAREYPTDLVRAPTNQGFGNALEILDYKLYKWPGHGLGDNVAFQAVELEAMQSDEYEMLLDDPSDLWLRRYLPRIFGALAPLGNMPTITNVVELPQVATLAAFGAPGIRDALNKLADAGDELLRVKSRVMAFAHEAIGEMGCGLTAGGGAKAPFDVLADTMRASRGMMLDMYRHGDRITAAVEKITPLQVKNAVAAVEATGNPLVFMPLHKGADGFMSDQQFQELYWPSLKDVIKGLVDEGCVPFLFAEGGFNSRLDYLNELPKGTTLWLFDQTDMAEAKRRVGGTVCIAGNVPSGLLVTGTPDQVDDYCRQLMDDCAPGGGYMLCSGAIIDEGKAGTTRALIEAAEKYGKY